MRVIAGQVKGTNLFVPQASKTRPTTDRTRQVLFDTLGSISVIRGRVLDLFAGSGALGIEALSRGASEAHFVEISKMAADTIRRNLERTHLEHIGKVTVADAFLFLNRSHHDPFDLILADPPYRLKQKEKIFALLGSKGWLTRDGVLVFEDSGCNELQVPDGFELVRSKTIGDTLLYFFKLRE